MNDLKKFDLEERTEKFSTRIIIAVKKFPENFLTKPLLSQLIKAGTSIGANYCEANNAASRKDFRHKISICKKESRETIYWLSIIAATISMHTDELRLLTAEARELNLIFGAIFHSSKENPGKCKIHHSNFIHHS
ncbi:four helix bundle protein [Candidatus Peregrinibacteria bacterium]|nr:four helix bundle protein [Candidatus Peregrinibacteria bacterium]